MAHEASFLRELLGLRGLLDQAVAAAKVPGELRRTTSVVLMDAANERALHMAAVKLGVASKRDDFEQLLSGVKNALGDAWKPRELSSIRKLHRMRNLVQHEGVGADRSDIEAWAISTQLFVRELVLAAFGVSLESATLADAIADEGIRGHIVAAQTALDEGDVAASMESTGRAFLEATTRWNGLASSGAGQGPIKPISGDVLKTPEFGYLDARIDLAENTASLMPLAADPGELVWYLGTSQQVKYLDEADAQRAQNFVFWWIVAFEAASTITALERRRDWIAAQRAARQGPGPAQISHYELLAGHAPGRISISFTLESVPTDTEFDDWRLQLAWLLRQQQVGHEWTTVSAEARIEINGVAASRFDFWVDAAQQALTDADSRVEELRKERLDSAEAAQDRVQAFATELAQVAQNAPNWVAAVELLPEAFGESGRDGILVTTLLRNRRIASRVADIVREHGGIEQAWHRQAEGIMIYPALPAADIVAVLASATPQVQQLDAQERDEAAAHRNAMDAAHAILAGRGLVVKQSSEAHR